ncbi:MAG TPA: protease modulator HflC [Alphaproteobacteria bacterium]|nr:protease modulator HflC [Alphaproteobacteria bacterium]HAM47199.1 protease modulator HflC [Alphaproteobacteria bacterium]HBA42115.1 protease modulator HflC [Alphaproteobacteria bacterium]HBC53075.1 protease modulator HflC [Alphaproteobacteria bacterium]HBF97169.1 protease modulator HflC [Alphaproteobacteria bacterium]
MNRKFAIFLLIIIGVAGLFAYSMLFTVHQSQQALVLQFGDPRRLVQEPGLAWKLPFVQNVTYFEKRILDQDIPEAEVIASDQKRLVVDAFARYRITDPLKFRQTVVTTAAVSARLTTLLNAGLRQVLGKESFFTILSGERTALMGLIQKRVNREAEQFGIEVVDVRIRRVDLPDANSQAIYRRMQTEREREAREARAQGAEEAQRIRSLADREKTVLLAEAKRDSEIIRGKGDAERNRIYAEAFGKDPEFFAFYRSMRAYEQALSSNDTTMVLSPDSEFFRYFGELAGDRRQK